MSFWERLRFWKKKPDCSRMVVEARGDSLHVLFDWPKPQNGEEKKRLAIELAHIVHLTNAGQLFPTMLHSLAVAGNMMGDQAVTEHSMRVINVMQREDNEEPPARGPMVRPGEVLNNSGRKGGQDD